MQITKSMAKRYRSVIESGTSQLDDKTVSGAVTLLPAMKFDGSLISSGTRICWPSTDGNFVCKRAAVDLWDTKENTPDAAPTLWEDISYKEGYRYIPETITVGLAFAKDECGWWTDGHLYQSLLDANVHTPEQYSTGWKLVK